jgi:SAM-dependent methyltransferase
VTDPFPAWFAALEARHLAELQFREVRKALQALSSVYVERRARVGAALDSAGKRAAFALFYGPLHFLTVRAVVRALGATGPRRILDLGCGTGAAGAAWALECTPKATVEGLDVSAWAAGEARWTYAALGLPGTARKADLRTADLGARGTAVLAGWTVNELAGETGDALRDRLVARGGPVLIVEPIAKSAVPWWDRWAKAFGEAGGRADEWRFPSDLPDRLKLLDRAAGLDHRQLTARSLYLPGA